MRHIDGQRGVETNHLAFTIVEPREPIHGENQFLMKPPKPAWILAPRPGLEPETCGLTERRSDLVENKNINNINQIDTSARPPIAQTTTKIDKTRRYSTKIASKKRQTK